MHPNMLNAYYVVITALWLTNVGLVAESKDSLTLTGEDEALTIAPLIIFNITMLFIHVYITYTFRLLYTHFTWPKYAAGTGMLLLLIMSILEIVALGFFAK